MQTPRKIASGSINTQQVYYINIKLLCRTTYMYIHTTGVAAGAWSCGIVVLLGELFGCESKSQVYGMLHTFIQENEESTSQLHKLYQNVLR